MTDAICYLVFFFPVDRVFSWLGWEFFWKSFEQGERFVTSPWMPAAWPLKFMIPLAGVLLLIQGVSEVLKSIYAAVNDAWPRALGRAVGDGAARGISHDCRMAESRMVGNPVAASSSSARSSSAFRSPSR